MANSVQYKDISLTIGDTVAVDYKIKESDDKERIQQFSGIIIKIKGDSDAQRMITVRKIAKSGTGVERIFPLSSPFIDTITVEKKSAFNKARAYFIRDLSNKKMRQKLYKIKESLPEEKKKDLQTRSVPTEEKVEPVKEEQVETTQPVESTSAKATADKEVKVEAPHEEPKEAPAKEESTSAKATADKEEAPSEK